MQVLPILQAMCLLTLANGTPVVAKKIFGPHLALPLDRSVRFLDGQPLLGASKTVRGVVLSLAVTAAFAPLLGIGVGEGGLVAAVAMMGDLLSSFVKRRLRFPPSTQAIGLDQIPESLLPLLVCRDILALTWTEVAICVGLFTIGELIVSRFLYWLRVRDEPY
jgi:hypothetical protein